jgi:hypothetical protein
MTFQCPVCGFPGLSDPPRTEANGGSYEICACCGFEFGVTDEDIGYSYEAWRKKWIAGGMHWRSGGIEEPPADWDPVEQLKTLR